MTDVPSWALAGPAAVLVLLLVAGWYLSYLARRLDRLHHRVESSWAALEEQLARRAAAASRVAATLPAEAGEPIARSAAAALAALGDEVAQSALTRRIRAGFADARLVQDRRRDPFQAELLDGLVAAAQRTQLARRFHNDAVAHAQRMRRKRVVRWARLAGHASWPVMVEIDDELPEPLLAEPV